jgi:hypothetical protein
MLAAQLAARLSKKPEGGLSDGLPLWGEVACGGVAGLFQVSLPALLGLFYRITRSLLPAFGGRTSRGLTCALVEHMSARKLNRTKACQATN